MQVNEKPPELERMQVAMFGLESIAVRKKNRRFVALRGLHSIFFCMQVNQKRPELARMNQEPPPPDKPTTEE